MVGALIEVGEHYINMQVVVRIDKMAEQDRRSQSSFSARDPLNEAFIASSLPSSQESFNLSLSQVS